MKRWTPGLLAAALLTGCSYHLYVKIEGDLAAPRVTVWPPGFAKPNFCLTRLWVAPANAPDQRIWDISADKAHCSKDGQVTYGQLPPGFTATEPVAPLQSGVRYQAFAYAGPVLGSLQFVFLDGAWHVLGPPTTPRPAP